MVELEDIFRMLKIEKVFYYEHKIICLFEILKLF